MKSYNKPITFFSITLLITWLTGFITAYLSYQNNFQTMQLTFILAGLLSPFITAISIIYRSKNKAVIQDFWNKLGIYKIKLSFLPILFFLLPTIVSCALFISLFFGQSINQFSLSKDFNVWQGKNIVGFLILLSAPIIEELGWRGYGIDSLRGKFNLFITSIVFSILWFLWHLPLFFIKGYYQYELLQNSTLYTLNFITSIFPATILINWVYYKNNRSIIAAIVLHLTLNIFSVIFPITQITKCIITLLLCIISGIVVLTNKNLFFNEK